MATKKLGTMSAGMRWLDRGCLALAFVTTLVVASTQRPAGQPLLSVTFEALGGVLPMALPAWMAHTWMRKPAPYHVFTLALALLLAFGRFSARHTRGQ